MRQLPRTILAFGVLLLTLLSATPGFAQTTTTTTTSSPVVVYRLEFQKTGDSVNYRPYQYGYYVAPLEGGTGSLVLTLVTGNVRQYFAYDAFGELFVAVDGKNQKMVLSATAANDVSTTVFYAIGKTERELEVESRNVKSKVKIAEKMTGYAVSADSERDLPYTGTGASVGVAGVSVLTAKIDESLTNASLSESLGLDAVVDQILTILETASYVDGRATNNGTGNTGTGTSTGTGTGQTGN